VRPGRLVLILVALACGGLLGGCSSDRASESSHRTTTSMRAITSTTTTPTMSPVETASGQSTTGALASSLETIFCTSEQMCMAAAGQDNSAPGGAFVALSTDGGSHWATTPPLAEVTQVNAMACPTSTSCIAVGWNALGNDQAGVVLQTFDGGHSWRIGPALPKGIGILHSVSCPTPTCCMVVGSSSDGSFGVALSTSSMGSQWSALSLPQGQRALSLVTCTTPGDCIVEGIRETTVGDLSSGELLSILTTADGGSTWAQSASPLGGPTGAANFKGLACSRPLRCLLVGDATPGDGSPTGVILASSDGGNTWASEPLPPDTTFLNAISCTSATNCVVVGGGIEARGGNDRDILTTSDGGQTWLSRPVPDAVTQLAALSCPTASACVATGFGPSSNTSGIQPVSAATSDGGAYWTAMQ
jgi:photosystem II stability/assembly factor-like uncharacterized protein